MSRNRAPHSIGLANHRLPASRLVAALALIAALAMPAAPQVPLRKPDPLTLEARIGWESAVRSGGWTPVTVWVTWQGDREIDGIVRVYDTSLLSEVQFHEIPVTLAPPSRKRLEFTIPYTPGAGEIAVDFESRDLGRQRAIRRSPRHWLDEDDVLIVVVARESNAVPSALYEWCRLWSSRGTETEAVAVRITPRDLTTHWADYEAIDLLVFLDCGDARFDPAAARAVAEWVETGGRILFTGGLEPALIETTALWPLLPVTPGTIGSTDSLPASLDDPGLSAGSRDAWFLREYQPRPGVHVQRWPRDGEVAALIDRTAGGGWAGFSPLAPAKQPLAAGEKGVQFWSYVFLRSRGGSSPLLAGAPLEQDPSWQRYWYGAPDRPPFPLTALAIYLGVYFLLVGPVNYFYLRRRARFGLVWVTVPALSVAFFLLAYAGGRLLWGNQLTVREISLVEVFPPVSGEDHASPARMVSRFRINSPARTSYDVGFGGEDVFVTQVMRNNPDNVKIRGFRVREDDGTELADLGFNMWSSRFVYASTVREVSGSVRGAASVADGRVHGTVVVDVPFEFEGTHVYLKGKHQPLELATGDSGRGARGRFEMNASGGNARPGQYGMSRGMPRFARDEDDRGGERVFEQALYYLDTSYRLPARSEPWFIGVRKESGRDLFLDGRPAEGERYSIYLAAIPIESEGEGMSLLPGLWRKEFHDPDGIVRGQERSLEIIRPGEVRCDFFAPFPPGPVEIRDLQILVDTGFLGMAGRLEIRDHEEQAWIELQRSGRKVENKTRIVLSDPESGTANRFIEAETGRVALRLKFEDRAQHFVNDGSVSYFHPYGEGLLPSLVEISARWRTP